MCFCYRLSHTKILSCLRRVRKRGIKGIRHRIDNLLRNLCHPNSSQLLVIIMIFSLYSAARCTVTFCDLDAAKKKQLPAWIREGLTKMEREKQKKLERERMVQEKFIMEQMQAEIKEEPGPLPVPAYVQVHTNVWGVSEVTCQTLPTYRTRLEEQKKSCTYKV